MNIRISLQALLFCHFYVEIKPYDPPTAPRDADAGRDRQHGVLYVCISISLSIYIYIYEYIYIYIYIHTYMYNYYNI